LSDAENADRDTTKNGGKPRQRRSHKGKESKKDDEKRSGSFRDSGSSSNDDKPPHNYHENTKKPTGTSSRIVHEILASDEYYHILGLTPEQVRQAADPLHVVTKAYRRRCVHTHPDKTGGDRSAFDKVAEAYHVLSDETQRKIYDRHGKRGLQQHQQVGGGSGGGGGGFGSAMSPEDLFRSFFEGSAGPGGFFRSSQQPRHVSRNRTTRYQLEVSLVDLYRGLSKTILVAPPPASPFQRPPPSPSKQKSVHVHIPRGTVEGQNIVLSGEIDFDPNDPPADLVFVVKQVPHPVFQCRGYDLVMKLSIPLSQALCGFSRTLTHLNGTPLRVSFGVAIDESETSGNDIESDFGLIRTGDVHVLKGQGMPKDETGRTFGDLYVVYEVEMPMPSSAAFSSNRPGHQRHRRGGGVLSHEERRELKRLLSKLEGNNQQEVEEDPVSSGKGPTTTSSTLRLKRAHARDIGRASGQPPSPSAFPGSGDGPFHHDNIDEGHPFHQHFEQHGPFGSRFFFSSSGSAAGANSSSSFFGMPGFDPAGDDGEGEGVQCRQM
jgi:DnaJ-class molecular chaperone